MLAERLLSQNMCSSARELVIATTVRQSGWDLRNYACAGAFGCSFGQSFTRCQSARNPVVSSDLISAACRQHEGKSRQLEGKNHRDRCSLSFSGLVAGLLLHDIVIPRPTIAQEQVTSAVSAQRKLITRQQQILAAAETC